MENLSALKLFKGYIGDQDKAVNKEALKYGLLINEKAPEDVVKNAISLYGKDGEKWNQTFHKSWKTVAETPIEDLIAQQLIHYFTVYGLEELGLYSEDMVYIPAEKLEIPEFNETVELVCIKALTKEEVSEKLMTLLTSGIALSTDTVECVKDLSDLIPKDRFDEIKNREVKIFLYDKYGIMPRDAEEFLRYMLYKLTGITLKIKDKSTLYRVSVSNRADVLAMLNSYLNSGKSREEQIKKLAAIYNRNKDFFISLKLNPEKKQKGFERYNRTFNQQYTNEYRRNEESAKQVNHIVNEINKSAKKNHKPLKVNILDRLTDPKVEVNMLDALIALDSITIFREARILNGLKYRLDGSDSFVYRIRNGASYITSKEGLNEEEFNRINSRYEAVKAHIIGRLKKNVEGKTVYIPKNVDYKLPTSEKQYVGFMPCQSSVKIDRNSDIIFGIHWKNLSDKRSTRYYDENRVDLDLHVQNLSESFGWNAGYKSGSGDILFSGDITDAPWPKGATELYYVAHSVQETYILTVNNYTYAPGRVPFEIVVAKAPRNFNKSKFNEDYVIDPNNIITTINMELSSVSAGMRIGTVHFEKDEIKFVFDNFATENVNVSRNNDDLFKTAFEYANAYQKCSANLSDLIEEAGAIIKDSPKFIVKEETVNEAGETLTEEKEVNVDYDLSLEKLDKETFIKLFM